MAKYKSHIRMSIEFMNGEYSKLSRYGQLTYVWYLKFRNKQGIAYPPQELLAELMHTNRNIVCRAIKELTKAQLLELRSGKQKRDIKNNKYGVNQYYVYDSMASGLSLKDS